MSQPYHRGSAHDQPLLVMGTLMSIMILVFPWLVQRLYWSEAGRGRSAVSADSVYQAALDRGWEAAVAVQSAQSQQEWEAVVHQWAGAIAQLQSVLQRQPDGNGAIQAKLSEYTHYREYALLKAELSTPVFQWQHVKVDQGEQTYFLVAPKDYAYSYSYPGPKLEISNNFKLENLTYINAVLANLQLPPIQSDQLLPDGPPQVMGNEYLVPDYALGELYLGRTQCGDPYSLNEQYDCLWKITIRQPDR